jgi:hypothetical protein
MNKLKNNIRLAQSASSLGAGLLGFGLGAKWGFKIDDSIVLIALIPGAIIHIAGMYLVQMKDADKAGTIARIIWITAWICLLILVGMFIYILL